MNEKLVTLPADLLNDLIEEADFHAAARPAGQLGPHVATVAAAVRAIVVAGGLTRIELDEDGNAHRRLVRLRKGRVRSGADVLTVEVA